MIAPIVRMPLNTTRPCNQERHLLNTAVELGIVRIVLPINQLYYLLYRPYRQPIADIVALLSQYDSNLTREIRQYFDARKYTDADTTQFVKRVQLLGGRLRSNRVLACIPRIYEAIAAYQA